MKPLTSLTGKGKWVWGLEQHKVFEELKRRMMEEPVLIVPRDDGKFQVDADSSNYANGAVLSQLVDRK